MVSTAIEDQRAQANSDLEGLRTQETKLQKYLEDMGILLTDGNLLVSAPMDTIRTVARAHTLTLLEAVNDPTRKRILIVFLQEAGLLQASPAILDLSGANLRKADLRGTSLNSISLFGADLRGALLDGASLNAANLGYVNLQGVDLRGVIDMSFALLSMAKLSGTNLSGTDLRDSRLTGANLTYADLSGADLSGANLQDTDLSGADLRDVDLSGADLSRFNEGTRVTDEQLASCRSLKGTTMPDGSLHD